MSLEDIFQKRDNDNSKLEAMRIIRLEKTIDAYALVERELSGSLRHNAFVTLASLDFDHTLPYLQKELRAIPDNYSWVGHPDYRACPFILTMEVILQEQDDRGKLQESIDTFKPISDREKAFFSYTLHCLFYNEPERKKDIQL